MRRRHNPHQRVKSAIDWWMHGVFIGINLATMMAAYQLEVQQAQWWLLLVIPVIVLTNWIWIETDYYLAETALVIRSGPFRETIAYDQIASVKPTTNLLSSMALSRQRLEIRQKNKNYWLGTTLISPVNREAFAAKLLQKIEDATANVSENDKFPT
ncbi:MAG: PH domain-containing protein [Culicoidibacterales bacterium]